MFIDNFAGISARASFSGDITFNFTDGNKITGSDSNAISAIGMLASGSVKGNGIRAGNFGSGTMTLLINDNVIQEDPTGPADPDRLDTANGGVATDVSGTINFGAPVPPTPAP